MLAAALITQLSTGCTVFHPTVIDGLTLKWLGKSYRQDLHSISLKQLHLEQTKFEGKTLQVTGHVETVGEQGTYFVLKQGERKILVIQYAITQPSLRVTAEDSSRSVRIIGTLTSQKKGLPALLASLVVASDPAAPKGEGDDGITGER